jgi:hypothetical protein
MRTFLTDRDSHYATATAMLPPSQLRRFRRQDMQFETDAKGIVTFFPLLEWGVSIVQGQTVGLAMDYYASAEDEAAKKVSRLQIHMAAEAARRMGEIMQSRAAMVLQTRAEQKPAP